MKKNKLKETSTEELIKIQKLMLVITGMFIGVLLVFFVATLYYSIRNKEFNFLMIVPIALSGILFNNYNTIKAIREELSNRDI